MDKYILDLQLFADGGGAAGGDGGAAAGAGDTTGVTAPVAGERNGRKRRENPLANVRYGVQPAEAPATDRVADGQITDAASEDQGQPREETFEELIKGKHRDAYNAKVNEIVRDRLKSSKESEEKLSKLSPLLEMLGKKYNVDPTDIDQMAKVIGDDDSLYEQEAMERGMDVSTYKTVKQLEQDNERYKQREQQSIQQQRMQQHFDNLARQAEQVKQLYPGFDLRTEMNNPTFARLIMPNSGIDVLTAYRTVHHDELKAAEMQFAVQKSAERMSKAVQANSLRPVENGLNSVQAGAPIKTDPRSLNKDDRAEIRRRVRNGEKIVF